MVLATAASILLNHWAKNSGVARQFRILCTLYTHLQINKPLNCRISFNPAFRHSAQCVLGHRRGQFGQRTGTDQGISICLKSLSCLLSFFFFFPFCESPRLDGFLPFSPGADSSLCVSGFFLSFPSPAPPRRTSRRKRRPPARRSPCRKPRRWLKSARCLLPTSPLQRESRRRRLDVSLREFLFGEKEKESRIKTQNKMLLRHRGVAAANWSQIIVYLDTFPLKAARCCFWLIWFTVYSFNIYIKTKTELYPHSNLTHAFPQKPDLHC